MSIDSRTPKNDLIQTIDLLHDNEKLKFRSRYLRGNIAIGLEDKLTGAVPGDDPLLMKFHGIYQQDDRDKRQHRALRKMEPNYQFMVRLRIPGGRLTPSQWTKIDKISRQYSERGIRITTRQTIQFHGVRKSNLKKVMQAIHDAKLDTRAACGDDNRGVVSGINPEYAEISDQIAAIAARTSDRLAPRTNAYSEVWYGETGSSAENEEPIYGPLYLPRKFKIGFVIPPLNDIDVYGQDLGFIAIVRENELTGFNVCVGGGMGQLDNRDDSYPRLAESIGSIAETEVPEFAEIVMGIQRDYGDRKDRHRARFKYTLDRLGMAWFLNELHKRRGKPLQTVEPFTFTGNHDRYGWVKGSDDNWYATLFIENGRIDDALQSRLSGFFEAYGGRIRLTTNQNLQLTHVGDYEVAQVRRRLKDMELDHLVLPKIQAAHTISCVALPTCGLAMAEAERYAPKFLNKFIQIKERHNLENVPVTLRISGCPNGCARPYIAEVALTGRAPGLYNLYLGGSFHGDRLATLYESNINEEKILYILNELFSRYSAQRHKEEHFGDFLFRSSVLQKQD